jgi:peroxiredoxin
MAAVVVAATFSMTAFAEEEAHSTHKHGSDTKHEHRTEAAPAAAASDAAPDFTLEDADGKKHSLADFKGKVVVLEWTNPDCPFVRRHYKAETMRKLAVKYADKGVVWVAVNSTKTNKPADSKAWTKENDLPYPTLQDPEGTVGKAYGAKTTPHMFVIDKDGKIAYQGAIDDDPTGDKGPSAVNYVDAALERLVNGEQPETVRTKSYGCSVKYKTP